MPQRPEGQEYRRSGAYFIQTLGLEDAPFTTAPRTEKLHQMMQRIAIPAGAVDFQLDDSVLVVVVQQLHLIDERVAQRHVYRARQPNGRALHIEERCNRHLWGNGRSKFAEFFS